MGVYVSTHTSTQKQYIEKALTDSQPHCHLWIVSLSSLSLLTHLHEEACEFRKGSFISRYWWSQGLEDFKGFIKISVHCKLFFLLIPLS